MDRPPQYDSGNDFVLEYLGVDMTFNEIDFAERLEYAAKKLGIIEMALANDELDDLVDFVTDRAIEPESEFAEHLQTYNDSLYGNGPTQGRPLVHWLKRLMVRQAWLDTGVKSGELDFEFDPETGDFVYVDVNSARSEVYAGKMPSWNHVSWHSE